MIKNHLVRISKIPLFGRTSYNGNYLEYPLYTVFPKKSELLKTQFLAPFEPQVHFELPSRKVELPEIIHLCVSSVGGESHFNETDFSGPRAARTLSLIFPLENRLKDIVPKSKNFPLFLDFFPDKNHKKLKN